ncbi:MAG TPA: leucyl/phenylalanyl-tRNA--protein transferase [Gallionella sp.]|nr:leucyl/phenylalanyl-tRNA--protein transferase [Gallionella sp.]
MIPWLTENAAFPPVELALRSPNGLLAAGGDLSVPRLLEAYRHGIFPWFNRDEPILWWSPDPRMVLIPSEFKISHSLSKILRKGNHEVRVDTAFEQVMRACAAPREGASGTWIHEELIEAYCALHELGYAHSVETWLDGELVGGLYGIAIGRMFYGESMFSRRSDASKIALAHLARQLGRWQFGMIDCQMNTPHLASLGARAIPRSEFLERLGQLTALPGVPSPWHFEG